jgi:hypothetical protein
VRPPWTAHRPRDPFFDADCERCGAWFAVDCYRRHTALSALERWWWTADGEDCERVPMIFLCRGCRS